MYEEFFIHLINTTFICYFLILNFVFISQIELANRTS